MANKTVSNLKEVTTVSNLKEVTTVSNSDVLLVETSTETLKVTKGNLLKEVNEELNAKSDANHTHDEYVTESELNSKGLATEMFVTNKIAEAQLGNDGGNMDLSGYATTEYVDQEVAQTNAQLSQELSKNKYRYVDEGVVDLTDFLANADEKYLFVKKGNYTLGDVEINESVNIEIHDEAVITQKDNSSYMLKFNGCDNVTLKGVFVAKTNIQNDPIQFINVKNVNLDVTVNKSGNNGVSIKQCDNVFGNINVSVAKLSGVRIEDTSNVELNVNISDVGANGTIVVPFSKDIDNVKIKGVIKNCASTISDAIGVYFNSGDDYIVKNSTIEVDIYNAGFIGIFPGGDNNTVINSNVFGSGLVTAPAGHGIRIHDSSNISIINCKSTKSKRSGFEVDKAHNVTFTNCYSYDNEQSGFLFVYDEGGTGRYTMDKTNKNITLTNCYSYDNGTILANNYAGYVINGFRNINFINCCAFDTKSAKTQERGIRALNNAKTKNINIINCNFENNVSNVGVLIDASYLGNTSFIDGEGTKYSFNGATPAIKQSPYSVNNLTLNRYIDLSNVDINKLSQVVATLINDLTIKGLI